MAIDIRYPHAARVMLRKASQKYYKTTKTPVENHNNYYGLKETSVVSSCNLYNYMITSSFAIAL